MWKEVMKLIVSLSLCVCLAGLAHAQNWPSFRGPNASGVNDARPLPASWNAETSQNIKWKTAIPGLGHSSPVVWGNRIFLTAAISSAPQAALNLTKNGGVMSRDLSKHSWRIYCFDKGSGKLLWERTAYDGVPKIDRHARASQANSTPATNGKYVVAFFGSEGLYCYDVNGRLLWKKDLGLLEAGYFNDPKLQWGWASSPIIHCDLAIVQCDSMKNSFVAAFDLASGKEMWRSQRDELPSWSTPIVSHAGGREELITVSPRFVRGLELCSGDELWRFADKAENRIPVPLFGKGLIFISGGVERGREFYALRAGASGEISSREGQTDSERIAWRVGKGSTYVPSPILYGDYFYMVTDSAVLSCHRATTGELLYLERVPAAGSSYSASIVAGDGKLYLASEDGEIHVVRAGPKFELLASNAMGEALMATPAISDGMLIVRGQQHLFAIAPNRRASAETQPKPPATDLLAGGKYPAGFRLIVREDATRAFTLKSGVAGPRPIRMFVWYPARAARGKQPMAFRGYVEAEGRGITNAAARLSETMGGVALSETQVQTVIDSPARAFADAAAAPGRFPLVLLGGGLNGTAYHHTLLAEYLASHGYVVAALSPLPEREGERLPFDKTGLGVLVGDLQFALRELAAEPQVDINRLGLAGWSVGGVALAAVAAQDARVDAFVSLDSGLSYDYGLPLLDQYLPGRRLLPTPLLDLRGLAPNRFVVARDQKYFESAPGGVLQVNVASLNHAQCTSLTLLVSSVSGVGDKADSRDGYRALAAYTKAFLDRHVRGDRRAAVFLSRDPAGNGFPAALVTVTSQKGFE
jgi:outer membrane protein assembly factor BamB